PRWRWGRQVDLLHAAESAVAAVNRGNGECEGAALVAVSQLVGQLFFRMEARAPGDNVGWLSGKEQLAVDPRRRSQRARDGRPQGPRRAEPPAHTAAGLDLVARLVVVLNLGAECNWSRDVAAGVID